MKRAFTLIELVMVIVIIGILAAVAIPKFQELNKQAHHLQSVQEYKDNNDRDYPKGDVGLFCSETKSCGEDNSLFWESEVLKVRFRAWRNKELSK